MSKTIDGYKEGHRGQPVISKDFDDARQRLLIAAEGQDGSRTLLAGQGRTIVAPRTISTGITEGFRAPPRTIIHI